MWDGNALLTAIESAEEGKHFKSLPILWRELRRAYLKTSWRGFWLMSKYMAREYLEIESPHEAIHHAVVSMNTKLAKKIGRYLLERRDANLIKLTINKVLTAASLRRHAVVACSLIHTLGDAICQEQLEDVVQWLLPRCAEKRNRLDSCMLMPEAWKALGSIVPLLNTTQTHKIVTAAVRHPLWREVHVDRRNILPVLHGCIVHLDLNELEDLAKKVLPIVTTLKSDIDYVEAINLVCQIATLGDDKLKSTIAESLMPKGAEISNSVLIEAAPKLGRQIVGADELERIAERFAENIRLQVQRLSLEEDVVRLAGEVFVITKPFEDYKLVVHVGMNSHALATLSRQRDVLTNASIKLLVEAVLSMLVEPENVMKNKVELMLVLAEFGDRFGRELSQNVFGVLRPFATGNITEPTAIMTTQESKDPLNPFKMNNTEPTQVRGIAIYTLACIEKANPKMYGKSLAEILEPALRDINPDIRKYAFAAAKETPKLSSESLIALLVGTRDSDAQAAVSAFYAIATKKDLKLNKSQWDLLFYGVTMASESPDSVLRQAGAFVILNILKQGSMSADKRISELARTFSEDICFSVRNLLVAFQEQTTRL